MTLTQGKTEKNYTIKKWSLLIPTNTINIPNSPSSQTRTQYLGQSACCERGQGRQYSHTLQGVQRPPPRSACCG